MIFLFHPLFYIKLLDIITLEGKQSSAENSYQRSKTSARVTAYFQSILRRRPDLKGHPALAGLYVDNFPSRGNFAGHHPIACIH